jgi:digeranylgeranylglycerophospholipid reductase
MVIIECDVLVVGAGPAGSVAALCSAKYGLNTVLIEKNDNIGANTTTRVDSSPDFGLTEIINEIGLKKENLVYNAKWHSPSGSSFTLHSKIGEYYFKRGPDPDSFECSTVNKAIKNGCTLFGSVIVEEIVKDDGRFDEVTISQGAEKIEIKPEIIIAADGGKSIFHKYVDKRFVKKNRVAYGVTGKDFIQPDTSEIYFDAKLATGGYFYIVTSLSGLASAGIVLDKNKMKRSSGEYFNEFLSKKSTIADKIKSSTNKFVGEGHLFKLSQHTRDNLLLVGDAAGLIDPLMGYGMMPAIVSGYYAGKYSIDAIKKGDYRALKNYEREVKKRFNRRMSYVYNRIFESFDDKDLNTLIKMANDLEDRTDVDDLMARLSVPGLFHLLNVFLKNLPSSGRLLAKSCKSLCETIYMS